MTGKVIGIIGLSLIAGAVGGYVSVNHLPVGTGEKASTGAITEERVNQLIQNYISENPRDIITSLQQMQVREESERAAKQQEAVKELSTHFDDAKHYGIAGNAKGDITVVEFFDYNCPACKMMFESLDTLIKKDDQVRLVFVEYPIFGPQSDMNARIATAVALIAPEQYYDFHTGMMRHQGKVNADQAYEIAKNLGIDVEKLKAEVEKPDNAALIQKDRELAAKLHIQGTPAVIIGGTMVNSALSPADLEKRVAEARAAKQAE